MKAVRELREMMFLTNSLKSGDCTRLEFERGGFALVGQRSISDHLPPSRA
jgi:hypothetical protein